MVNQSLNDSALQIAMDAYEECFPDALGIDYDGLKAGIKAYLAAMGDASTRKDEGEEKPAYASPTTHTLIEALTNLRAPDAEIDPGDEGMYNTGIDRAIEVIQHPKWFGLTKDTNSPVCKHPEPESIQSSEITGSLRDKVAFFIATGGWDDRKKRFDDIQHDDYAKADAVLEYLSPYLKREYRPDWKPINTAPKDGNPVMIWLDDEGFAVKANWRHPPHNDSGDKCWWCFEMDEALEDFHNPTHWCDCIEGPITKIEGQNT